MGEEFCPNFLQPLVENIDRRICNDRETGQLVKFCQDLQGNPIFINYFEAVLRELSKLALCERIGEFRVVSLVYALKNRAFENRQGGQHRATLPDCQRIMTILHLRCSGPERLSIGQDRNINSWQGQHHDRCRSVAVPTTFLRMRQTWQEPPRRLGPQVQLERFHQPFFREWEPPRRPSSPFYY